MTPEDVVVNAGETVELRCYSSTSGYQLSWTKRQGRIPYSSRDQNGILTLYEVTPEDSGIYECVATSAITGATLTAQARVTVEAAYRPPPMARIDPERLDLAQGDQGSLRCLTEGV